MSSRERAMTIPLTHCPHCSGKGTSTDFSALGFMLACERQSMGISGRAMAAKLGISHNALRDFEQGREKFPMNRVAQFRRVLEEAV